MQQDRPDAPTFFSNYLISNPEEFASNILKAFEQGSEALTKLADRPDTKAGPYSPASELSAATDNLMQLLRLWLSDPVRLAEAQSHFVSQFAALWNNVLQSMMGMPVAPLIVVTQSVFQFLQTGLLARLPLGRRST
jgi:polyhydroxyalkanoate synthase subunit PhaC